MFRRIRYQRGWLQVESESGSERWVYRCYEDGGLGKRIYRKLLIGTIEEYPTESAAQAAVDALHTSGDQEGSADGSDAVPTTRPITIRDLIAHYKQTELSLTDCNERGSDEYEKAYSTKKTYRIYLDRWIERRWGNCPIAEVRTVAVEHWLRELTLGAKRKMARGTKAKIRNVSHSLFNHAIRWEWLLQGANPISKVRQSAKRERVPDILDVAEVQMLLVQLSPRDRTLVAVAATTGLRRGELFGLKWRDVDFEKLEISVTRSVVPTGGRTLQNRSLAEAGATRSRCGRGPEGMAGDVRVQPP